MSTQDTKILTPFAISRYVQSLPREGTYGNMLPNTDTQRRVKCDRCLVIQFPASMWPDPSGQGLWCSVVRSPTNEDIMSLFLAMVKITQPYCPVIWEPVVNKYNLRGMQRTYTYYRAYFPLTKDHYVSVTRGWLDHWENAKKLLVPPIDRSGAKRVKVDPKLDKKMHSNAMFSPDITRRAYNHLMNGKVYAEAGISTEIPVDTEYVHSEIIDDENDDGYNLHMGGDSNSSNVDVESGMTTGPSNSILELFSIEALVDNPGYQAKMNDDSIHDCQKNILSYHSNGTFGLPDPVCRLLGRCAEVRIPMNSGTLRCPIDGVAVAERILGHFMPHRMPSLRVVQSYILGLHEVDCTPLPDEFADATIDELFQLFRGNGSTNSSDDRYLDPCLCQPLKEANPMFATNEAVNLNAKTMEEIYPLIKYIYDINDSIRKSFADWKSPAHIRAINEGTMSKSGMDVIRAQDDEKRVYATKRDLHRVAKQANDLLRTTMFGVPCMYHLGYEKYEESCAAFQAESIHKPHGVMDQFLLRTARARGQKLDWFTLHLVQLADITTNGLNLASTQLPLFVKAHLFACDNYHNYFRDVLFLLSMGVPGAGKSKVTEVLSSTNFLVRRRDIMSRQGIQFDPYDGWLNLADDFGFKDVMDKLEFQNRTSRGATTTGRAKYSSSDYDECGLDSTTVGQRGAMVYNCNKLTVGLGGKGNSSESTKAVRDRSTQDNQIVDTNPNPHALGVHARVANLKLSAGIKIASAVCRMNQGLMVYDIVEAVAGYPPHTKLCGEVMFRLFDRMKVPKSRTREVNTVMRVAEMLQRQFGYHMYEMMANDKRQRMVGSRTINAKMLFFLRHTCIVTGWRAMLVSYFLVTSGSIFNDVVEMILGEFVQCIVWDENGEPMKHYHGPKDAPAEYYVTNISMGSFEHVMRTRFSDSCGVGLVDEALLRVNRMRWGQQKYHSIMQIPGSSAGKECKGNIAVFSGIYDVVMTAEEARNDGTDNPTIRLTPDEKALLRLFDRMFKHDKDIPTDGVGASTRHVGWMYNEVDFLIKAPAVLGIRQRSNHDGMYHKHISSEQFARATYFLSRKVDTSGRKLYMASMGHDMYGCQVVKDNAPDREPCIRSGADHHVSESVCYKRKWLCPNGSLLTEFLYSTYRKMEDDKSAIPTLSPHMQDAVNVYASIMAGVHLKRGQNIFVGFRPGDVNTQSAILHKYAPPDIETISTQNPRFNVKSNVVYKLCGMEACNGQCDTCKRIAAKGDTGGEDCLYAEFVDKNKSSTEWTVRDGDLHSRLLIRHYRMHFGDAPCNELLPHNIENADIEDLRHKFM